MNNFEKIPNENEQKETSVPSVFKTANVVENFESGRELLKSILKDGESVVIIDENSEISRSIIEDGHSTAREKGISSSPQANELLYKIEDLTSGELEKIKSLFKGKVLVDIGAGEDLYGYQCAVKLESTCYVAVEPYYFAALAEKFERMSTSVSIPFAIISSDGLSVLRKIRDGSASIMTSATDDLMLRNRQYNEQVNVEMSRVIGEDGGFLGFDTTLHPNGFDLKDVERIKIGTKKK